MFLFHFCKTLNFPLLFPFLSLFLSLQGIPAPLYLFDSFLQTMILECCCFWLHILPQVLRTTKSWSLFSILSLINFSLFGGDLTCSTLSNYSVLPTLFRVFKPPLLSSFSGRQVATVCWNFKLYLYGP